MEKIALTLTTVLDYVTKVNLYPPPTPANFMSLFKKSRPQLG